MLASAFRRNQPAVLLVLLLIVPLLWMPTAFKAPPIHHGAHMPLFEPLVWLMHRWAWAAPLFGVLFTLGIGVQLNVLVSDVELMDRRNHLPSLLFPLLLAMVPGGLRVDAALAGSPLLLWALQRAWAHQHRHTALGALFEAGLLIGTAALVYLPYLFMVVVIWASTAATRPFHWRDHLVPVIGAGLAFYLCWSLLWLSGATPWHPFATVVAQDPVMRSGMPKAFLASISVVVALFVLITTFEFTRNYRRSIMHGKNMRSAFLAFTVSAFLIAAFEGVVHRTVPAVLPASSLGVLFAYPLLTPRRPWLAEAGVLVLLALAAWSQWGQLSSPA